MSDLAADVEVKISTDAAQQFVETYYPALNTPHGRSTLVTFYIKPTVIAPLEADISMNGNVFANPAELQALLEKQISRAHYEVQSYDCQVLNANYNVGVDDTKLGLDKDGKKMSILVMVSGSVRYWSDGEEADLRGFTETFVLVPNWEVQHSKPAKGDRKWLIQSQNFRLVL